MRLTVDEFWEQYPFKPYELISGKPIKSEPLGFRYSIVGMRVESVLGEFVEKHKIGEVLGANNGFRLSNHTLRAPRVAYINRKKWQRIRYPYSYLPFPPDIAVEIFSNNVSEKIIRTICAQYVRSGSRYVWVFLPDSQVMIAYSRHQSPRTFQRDDILRVPEWHPDFAVPLIELLPKRKS